jgi:NAD(P)H dehydrogenase (quinone)
MIVITGATGALNGATVDHLLERVPASGIAVAVRDEAKAARFAALGIEVRRGDYADPASLPAAFDGADQLLLVSSNDPGADAVALHRTAVDAAVAAGVGRILYTSHQGADPRSPFAPATVHAATEGLLAESGVPWTALRNGFYAHSLTWLMGDWQTSGTVTVPVDGPVSWTAREDAAEAAAVVLASKGAFDGPVTLTADAAPTFAEIAASVGAGFAEIGAQAWLATQPDQRRAAFTLGMYEAAGRGFFAGVDPLLGSLLGRAPRGVSDVVN